MPCRRPRPKWPDKQPTMDFPVAPSMPLPAVNTNRAASAVPPREISADVGQKSLSFRCKPPASGVQARQNGANLPRGQRAGMSRYGLLCSAALCLSDLRRERNIKSRDGPNSSPRRTHSGRPAHSTRQPPRVQRCAAEQSLKAASSRVRVAVASRQIFGLEEQSPNGSPSATQ